MFRIRKRLNHTVIGNRNRRVSPLLRAFYHLCGISHRIHITHLRMRVKFYPFHRSCICPSCFKTLNFFHPHQIADTNFLIIGIKRSYSLYTNKISHFYKFFESDFFHHFCFDKNFDDNSICEISNRKGINLFSTFYVPRFINLADHSLNDNLTDFINNLLNRSDLPLHIFPIKHRRITLNRFAIILLKRTGWFCF